MAWLYAPEWARSKSRSVPSYPYVQSATSSGTRGKSAFLERDSVTAASTTALSGTISVPSTLDPGKVLTSSQAGGPARASQQLRGDVLRTPTCGPMCCGSLRPLGRLWSSWRTSTERPGRLSPPISDEQASGQRIAEYARQMLEHRTNGLAPSWLPTPTETANVDAPSMSKWPAHRRWQRLVTRTEPSHWEWMMGLPDGWTGSEPVGTRWFLWQRLMRIGLCSQTS